MSLNIEDGKFCPSCQCVKPPHQFNKDRKSKDGRQSYCRSCNALYQQNYKGALDAYLRYIDLRGGCCEVCGESYPSSVYDLHHVVPSSKLFNVPMRKFGENEDEAIEEANKCALLCANCHRQEHSVNPHGITLLPEGYRTPSGLTPEI